MKSLPDPFSIAILRVYTNGQGKIDQGMIRAGGDQQLCFPDGQPGWVESRRREGRKRGGQLGASFLNSKDHWGFGKWKSAPAALHYDAMTSVTHDGGALPGPISHRPKKAW